MSDLRVGPKAGDFIWASGIEDTFVPQTRRGHRALDEYELIGHYLHWREDLRLARDLGVKVLRWGVPWYRVEPQPGNFDWRWTDEVLPFMIEELGITPILDLMHYGCPFWMHREFANPNYPIAVAEYAEAFARRYQGLVRWYTPLNEPIVNALMCGKRGLWPPYLRGDRGYIRVMVQLALGIVNTVAVLKEIDPTAIMVHVEATGLSRVQREDLKILEVEEQRRGYLCFDLVTGRVTHDHPLFAWLVRSGASTNVLAELVAKKIDLDVIGMNFYPQWSTQQLYVDDKGHLGYRTTEHEGTGFAELIEDYHRRYRAPVMVTETSAFGDDELRSRWLESSVRAVKDLRSRGVPVIGYTWFPMFTMIDWKYRHGRAPVDQYRIELGLYRLSERIIGARWDSTPLVSQMQEYVANPEPYVGEIAPAGARLLRRFNAEHRMQFDDSERSAEPGMHTRQEKLDDGRYIVYYSFDDGGAGADDESARAEEEHHV